MSDDQDRCEWVSVSSGTGLPGSPGPTAVKRLCVCVCVCVRACVRVKVGGKPMEKCLRAGARSHAHTQATHAWTDGRLENIMSTAPSAKWTEA